MERKIEIRPISAVILLLAVMAVSGVISHFISTSILQKRMEAKIDDRIVHYMFNRDTATTSIALSASFRATENEKHLKRIEEDVKSLKGRKQVVFSDVQKERDYWDRQNEETQWAHIRHLYDELGIPKTFDVQAYTDTPLYGE